MTEGTYAVKGMPRLLRQRARLFHRGRGRSRALCPSHPEVPRRGLSRRGQICAAAKNSETVNANRLTKPSGCGRMHMLSAWGHSSVGRALEWHSRGQGFDSPCLHQTRRIRTLSGVRIFLYRSVTGDVGEYWGGRRERERMRQASRFLLAFRDKRHAEPAGTVAAVRGRRWRKRVG